jgi:hypothetical protein
MVSPIPNKNMPPTVATNGNGPMNESRPSSLSVRFVRRKPNSGEEDGDAESERPITGHRV